MKFWKRTAALCLTALLLLTACGKQETPETPEVPEEEAITMQVGALKGPTAMGLAMLEDTEGDDPRYALTIGASADEITPGLLKGELDVACVPANLAAVLYNQTEGDVVVLGINTLGVLYIVENGNAVQSLADLAGKTMVASGKGSTPEYALRYLLKENGVDPDGGVIIDWKSEHSECVSALATGAATIAMLPQPFVTVAQGKMGELRMALDLTAEWSALDNGSALLTGVVVSTREFVEAHPQAVADFLTDYAASVESVNADPAAAAVKIEALGIVEAAVAEQALPACNIVCITGEEMRQDLSGYLQVLYGAAPDSVGGALPGDDFYYGV